MRPDFGLPAFLGWPNLLPSDTFGASCKSRIPNLKSMNRSLVPRKQAWMILALASLTAADSFAQAPAPPQPASATNRAGTRGGRDPKMDSHYKLGPDSMPQEGVPKGRFDGPKIIPSEVFPGTQHTYWVYVPAQYDPAKPAALIVFNDGQAFKNEPGDVQAQHVLDNLIYRREIPVMLGVFINPGRRPDQPEPTPRNWGDRDTNRPEEYNALNDKYPRVIVEELLPALRKEYNISNNPEHRAIGGASSGGIAAFTVAWYRPEQFGKVFSFVGSFVNLGNRGGHTYPDLVLESERKQIRVFLQDGRNDNRGGGRGGSDPNSYDWFYQNVRMADALTRKGYDVNYTWGIGNHGQKQGGAIFPEIMRWLWRDTEPVSTDRNDTVERSFRAPHGER
jgi:enterochelin esterase family protein